MVPILRYGNFQQTLVELQALIGKYFSLTATGLLPASHRESQTNWKMYHQTLTLHISPSLAGPSSFKSPTQLSEKNAESFF